MVQQLSGFAASVEEVGGLPMIRTISSCIEEGGGDTVYATNLRLFGDVTKLVGGPSQLGTLLIGVLPTAAATGARHG